MSSAGFDEPSSDRAASTPALDSIFSQSEWSYFFPSEDEQSKQEKATKASKTSLSKSHAGRNQQLPPLVASVATSFQDVATWFHVYGGPSALALALFGRKSIWKTQARVLATWRPRRGKSGRTGSGPDPGPGPGPGPDPDPDPWGRPDDSGDGRRRKGRQYCACAADQVEQEYQKMIEGESTRIGVSVGFCKAKAFVSVLTAMNREA